MILDTIIDEVKSYKDFFRGLSNFLFDLSIDDRLTEKERDLAKQYYMEL